MVIGEWRFATARGISNIRTWVLALANSLFPPLSGAAPGAGCPDHISAERRRFATEANRATFAHLNTRRQRRADNPQSRDRRLRSRRTVIRNFPRFVRCRRHEALHAKGARTVCIQQLGRSQAGFGFTMEALRRRQLVIREW